MVKDAWRAASPNRNGAVGKECSVRTAFLLMILSFVFLAGCAGKGAGTSSSPGPEYVEIDNPGYTMSPNAPPTIWVPRSYVDSGIPRGSELIKEGYEAAKSSMTETPVPKQKQAPMAAAPLPAPAAPVIKSRVAVLDVGKTGLAGPFAEILKKSGGVLLLDQSQVSLLGRYAALATPAERSAFSTRLQEDYGANRVLFVSAPEGIAPGKMVRAEIYDAMGGGLVRTVESAITLYPANDQASRDPAVSATLMRLADQTREVLSLLPWYGKVVAVEGDRVYINAGKESDLKTGRLLKVFRGGKVVPGLGFAPGKMVGVVEIAGFVGINGSYGVVREGAGIQASDLVAAE